MVSVTGSQCRPVLVGGWGDTVPKADAFTLQGEGVRPVGSSVSSAAL